MSPIRPGKQLLLLHLVPAKGSGCWISFDTDPIAQDGTIYALVNQAIEDARHDKVPTVSLGCVPFSPPCHSSDLTGWAQKQVFKRSGSLKGLYQFKNCFDPIWQDRYIRD